MKRAYRIERRKDSIIKPILYLLLQIVALYELFWVLTGSADFMTWDYIQIGALTLFILYFAKRTYEVMGRMKQSRSPWYEKMEMERFSRAHS